MIECKVSVAGFDAARGQFRRGVGRGLDRCGQVSANQVTRQKRLTYGRKVRMTRKRKPAWVRTGNYLEGTEVQQPSEFERRVVNVGPAAAPITNYPGGYAQRLANLPTGPDGINRSNPAMDNARRIVKPQVKAIMEQGLLEAGNS